VKGLKAALGLPNRIIQNQIPILSVDNYTESMAKRTEEKEKDVIHKPVRSRVNHNLLSRIPHLFPDDSL